MLPFASRSGHRCSRRLLLLGLAAKAFTPSVALAALQETQTIAAFHQAADKGDVAALREMIAAHPTLVNSHHEGLTALGRAAYFGKLEAAQFLLANGADPNLAKPDGAAPLHDAVFRKDTAFIRLLLEHKANTEMKWKQGITPLFAAVESGAAESVRLLLAKEAKRDARIEDGRTPTSLAVLLLAAGGEAPAPKEGAVALLEQIAVDVTFAQTSLADAFRRLFTIAGVEATVDAALTAPVSAHLKGGLDTGLALLLRTARRSGQPVSITQEAGVLRVAAGVPPAAVRQESWPVLTANPKYRFDRSISLSVLNAYLSRAVTHFGLLCSSPEPATPFFEDDLRMLTNIGAKFIGRCAYAWEPPDDDEAHFRLAAERAARAHAADPSFLLQAAIFETAYRKVEKIPVPAWVFAEFKLPVEKRNFRYEAMLYDGGKLHNHWMQGASVPDMSKPETKMWFYYRARRYIDSGCEALDFGQVHLMDHQDPGHKHWSDLLARVRRYAATYARRRFVLCDAHTHGIATNGQLLFDLHAFPLITKDIPDRPRQVELVDRYYNVIYGRSRGGVTPSGWQCSRLPYLAEVDNGGTSDKPWQSVGFPWVWGVDSISWFAHLSQAERTQFLFYARRWLQARGENGWFQPPTRRVLAVPVNGNTMYHANRKSEACPAGFSDEDTLKSLFAAS